MMPFLADHDQLSQARASSLTLRRLCGTLFRDLCNAEPAEIMYNDTNEKLGLFLEKFSPQFFSSRCVQNYDAKLSIAFRGRRLRLISTFSDEGVHQIHLALSFIERSTRKDY